MAKISKAPKNFYTAAEAAKKLGLPKTTFFQQVREGKIKKVVPPGQVEGYYPKTEIDKMAKARELFILEYASEPSTFARATEEDIKDIHALCMDLFGVTGTPSYETMLSWQQKNPYTYHVLKQEGIVTGYIGFLYLSSETVHHIMAETLPELPSPPATEVLPFTPDTPIDGLFAGIAVRQDLPPKRARIHGLHLIMGGIEVLEDFARKGMPVRKLYATSRSSDGIKLSRKLGFQETTYEGDPIHRFEVDLETSDSPLLKEYRKIIKQRSLKTAKA